MSLFVILYVWQNIEVVQIEMKNRALSRTAVKKKWPDPPVKGRLLRWFGAAPAKPEDDPDRSRCGGADLATD